MLLPPGQDPEESNCPLNTKVFYAPLTGGRLQIFWATMGEPTTSPS